MALTLSLGCNTSVIPIADTVTLTVGTFGTASNGRLNAGETGAGKYPMGIITGAADGTTLTGNTAGTVKAAVESGVTILIDVVGASALTNHLAPVYIASATTLTLSDPGSSIKCGFVKEWVSGTKCKVYLYTPAEILAL